jgi:hypothetical protein
MLSLDQGRRERSPIPMKARPTARASIPDGFRGLGHTGALRDGLSLDDVDGDANGALPTATQITLEKAPVAVSF